MINYNFVILITLWFNLNISKVYKMRVDIF